MHLNMKTKADIWIEGGTHATIIMITKIHVSVSQLNKQTLNICACITYRLFLNALLSSVLILLKNTNQGKAAGVVVSIFIFLF